MKRLRLRSMGVFKPLLLLLVGILIVVGLLFFRIGSLTPITAIETASRSSSDSFRHILASPINAPYKIPVYLLLKINHRGITALRSVTAIYGLLTLGVFYYILKRWQTSRIALFGTILFGTSTWFLHTARFGTPEVLLFGLLAMVAAGLWLREGHWRKLALFACIGVLALAFYIPGLIWFGLLGAIWRRQVIIEELRHIPWWVITIGTLAMLLVGLPLVLAVYQHHDLALIALGLPTHLPSLVQISKNALDIPLFLFIRGPFLPSQWLGRTPILDVFATAMFILGVYADIRYRQLDRASLLLGVLVLGVFLIMLGGPVTITILIPFVYLIIATGITYLLYEWFNVFPLNPIARGVGVGLLALAIVASSSYQLDRYFIAWPHSPATKLSTSQKS